MASGKLEPLGSVKDIQMPLGGVVEDILVREGERVQANQILLKLDTEADLDKRESLDQTIALKQEQLKLKQEERIRYLELNSTEQRVLRENLLLQQELLGRYRNLAEQGAWRSFSSQSEVGMAFSIRLPCCNKYSIAV